MESLVTFLVLIFVVLPLIAVFSFTSTVTRGVYDWSRNQTIENNQYEPEPEPEFRPQLEYAPVSTTKVRTFTKKAKKIKAKPAKVVPASFSDYAGYPEHLEDSEEFKEMLDNNNFDVREFLSRND